MLTTLERQSKHNQYIDKENFCNLHNVCSPQQGSWVLIAQSLESYEIRMNFNWNNLILPSMLNTVLVQMNS